MTRSEVRSPPFLVFLDGHLGIAKGHALNPVAILDVNHRLLLAIGCFALGYSTGFIERYAFTFVRCHYLGSPKIITGTSCMPNSFAATARCLPSSLPLANIVNGSSVLPDII